MEGDEASEVSNDRLEKTPNTEARNLRFYYFGNDWETLTCLRRNMTGPNLCFRIII